MKVQATSAVRALDDPVGIRHAGRELLSLALIDSRNHLLRLLAMDEATTALRLAVRAGWYQDHWIARHVQRQRGESCDPHAPRLAGIEPQAESWLNQDLAPPTADQVRAYLAEILDICLDLLAAAEETDEALHFYRMSLLHEDRLCETLTQRLLLGAPPSLVERDPLWMPGQRWNLGSARGGLVPQPERWAHEVEVPEFEIDAQPVNWGRFGEFASDGGYDRRELWSDAGWNWVQQEGRRAPRHVEQMQGGVLVMRGAGKARALQRAPAPQPVLHVTRFEAEAWCNWAGRRLPTEPEWEIAASLGASRGFQWGDVLEWVAGGARAWPNAGPVMPGSVDASLQERRADAGAGRSSAVEASATHGVLRGASYATRSRWIHPKSRRYGRPDRDTFFSGFRSCAV